MLDHLDPIDQQLLDDFQRDFPLIPRPFAAMATRLDLSEADTLTRLRQLQSAGRISRVGATVRPNTAGASTLAALAVPETRVEEVAALVGAEPGVNHSYLREHGWNLWFVATAPDANALDAALARIRNHSGLSLLDLRLIRPFNIDLGFSLRGARRNLSTDRSVDVSKLRDCDRPILQALSSGLPLIPHPFAALAKQLNRSEDDILTRIATLHRAGVLTRIGVIVRHRAIGWSANAMVVWNLPEARIETAGKALAQLAGITLCYQRRTVPGVWPYGLFSMIHARSRSEAQEVLDTATALPALAGATHEALFSTRCFKQTGAQLAALPEQAA
jgi:DNA-binding Lrp family transcriptional regulator